MTLVVLAAGLGTRYGGLKQLDGVGPNGATLMDFSVYDARRAGFTEIVFVIRPDMEESFHVFARRYAGVSVRTAHQESAPERAKPWGTAHAVLAARSAVQGPFTVINADDFYGAEAFVLARGAMKSGLWAALGYRLLDVVPKSGAVSRAMLEVNESFQLVRVTEKHGIERRSIIDDGLVSMNMWAFTPKVFETLELGFAGFRRHAKPTDEYLLPDAVNAALNSVPVVVYPTKGPWLGLTNPGDREHVARRLRALVAAGVYPERLFP